MHAGPRGERERADVAVHDLARALPRGDLVYEDLVGRETCVVDGGVVSRFQRAFGPFPVTPNAEAIRLTAEWYLARLGEVERPAA